MEVTRVADGVQGSSAGRTELSPDEKSSSQPQEQEKRLFLLPRDTETSSCPRVCSSLSHPTRSASIQLPWQMLTRAGDHPAAGRSLQPPAASLCWISHTALTALPYLRLQSTGDKGLSQLCLREVDMDLTSVGKDSVVSCRSRSSPISSGLSAAPVPLFKKWQSASP